MKIDLNGGYRGHTGSGTVLDLKERRLQVDGNLITFGGGIAVRVLDPLDLVAETYGTYLTSTGSGSDVRLSNEAVGGIKLFVERNSYLMLGGGAGYTRRLRSGATSGRSSASSGSRRSATATATASRTTSTSAPTSRRTSTASRTQDGCPDPDNDNDGIPDVDDRCPNEPEDRDGDQDADGCPEGGDGDRDGDGILDKNDKCPDEPEDKDGFQDHDGCPDPDNDKDGIPDKKDQCPNDPEDKDNFQDADGCPDPDNDKDGIPDVIDKCPNEPETFNGFQDEDGCPDKGSVIIQENNIVILDKIKFKTGSAEILPESNEILDAVSDDASSHHPEFTLVEVAGHADERSRRTSTTCKPHARPRELRHGGARPSSRKVNKSTLSARRATANICPEDPGPQRRVAWEKNRRVEFKIVKTKDGPTGVELGCPNAVSHNVRPDPVP